MSYMFNDCYTLQFLNTNNLDTTNVKNMSHIFNYCGQLIEINIIVWIKKYQNYYRFYKNYSLKLLIEISFVLITFISKFFFSTI